VRRGLTFDAAIRREARRARDWETAKAGAWVVAAWAPTWLGAECLAAAETGAGAGAGNLGGVVYGLLAVVWAALAGGFLLRALAQMRGER
jgi:hypothetical protein